MITVLNVDTGIENASTVCAFSSKQGWTGEEAIGRAVGLAAHSNTLPLNPFLTYLLARSLARSLGHMFITCLPINRCEQCTY